jgi:hypothetical protein
MGSGYFFMEAREIKPKPDIHLFIVFDNDVSFVHFDADDDPDVYYIEDERLDDEKLWREPTFFDMFLDDISVAGEQGRRIIVLNYNPAVAQCVAAFFKFFKEFETEGRVQWHALSFFHSDEETVAYDTEWTDPILAKVYAIDSLNNFPWIEKIEVPAFEYFYHRDLLKLVLSEEDFNELDNADEEPYARLDNKEPPQIVWVVPRE